MKVVINACFGGFSLSKAAVLWLAARGHQAALKEKAEMDAASEKWRGTTQPGGLELWEWRSAQEWLADEPSGSLFGYSWHVYESDGLSRHDPLLVACVEELGGERKTGAGGPCASLKVVEIPDDVEYQIEEYDGNEWVAEKHRTWQ